MNDRSDKLPATSGVSLKPEHYREVLETLPEIGWFEIHPENYMGEGGSPHRYLSEIRDHYPLSMHGVGMSLGSSTGIDPDHLRALCELVNRYEPQQVSEHLAWSHFEGTFLNDLLPLPYHEESLQVMSTNIDRVQNALGRTILVENPSTYVNFNINTWSEPEFLRELVKQTGCGLLLDVNNIYVSACNQGFDPYDYLSKVPIDAVGEVHLAGHTIQDINGVEIRIDDHGSPVCDAVWRLHESLLHRLASPGPVLIEWDTDIPEFSILMDEAGKSDSITRRIFHSPEKPVTA
jgi:hypothetical protein